MRQHLNTYVESVWWVPLRLIPLVLGASSIASLLLYFYGVVDMRQGVQLLLLPAIVILMLVMIWLKRTGHAMFYRRFLSGLWAGALATLAYDVVRVPIAWSGVPVFKAISYFGTVILGSTDPTLASEVVGWVYHLSNGIGFGLMYMMLVTTTRWWTAVLWGLALEGAMLLTPYAEVFGYRISPGFLAITIGSHVIYGLTLWAALRYWSEDQSVTAAPPRRLPRAALICVLVPLGIGAIAVDFHLRHAEAIPPSPPGYLGVHLYTTWNVPEPDRVAALWVLKRFVNPKARFHFITPFSPVTHGTPFDIPEAEIRRQSVRSVTEELLTRNRLEGDARLALLGKMAHLYEIAPWMRPSDRVAQQLGQELIAATGPCTPSGITECVNRAFWYLDGWYER